MNLDELGAKINTDLIGKVVNLASRSAESVLQVGLPATYPEDGGLFEGAAKAGDEIAEAYDYNRAMRLSWEANRPSRYFTLTNRVTRDFAPSHSLLPGSRSRPILINPAGLYGGWLG